MTERNLTEIANYKVNDHVLEAIKEERRYQLTKWGTNKSQSIPGYLLVMRKELEEAEEGWIKNIEGRNSCLAEILQVVAVGIACLEEHDITGNTEYFSSTLIGKIIDRSWEVCSGGDMGYPSTATMKQILKDVGIDVD